MHDSRIATLLKCGGHVRTAARQLGISPRTLRDHLYKMDFDLASAQEKGPVMNRPEAFAFDEQDRELGRQPLAPCVLGLEEPVVAAEPTPVEKFLEYRNSEPDWVLDVSHKRGSLGVPITMWSDWHVGEVVSRSHTTGFNEFNLEIADRRIKRLVEKTIELCQLNVPAPKAQTGAGMVLCLGGDMGSGDLHEELRVTNQLTSMETCYWLIDRLARAIRAMADVFGKLYVPCVPGNHGRTTMKPWAKLYPQQNLDWLVYRVLQRELSSDERITFDIPDSGDAHFTVAGHRYMLTHGDRLGVRGGDGQLGSLGPIVRGAFKTARQMSMLGRPFDTLLCGHWHQSIILPGIVIANNALKGFDEYAASVLRAGPSIPSQLLWFTHPDHGITWRGEIYLEDGQGVK